MMPLSQEPSEVGLELGEDEVVVAFRMLWPRVEVFNCRLSVGRGQFGLISRAYNDNMVIFHIPRR